MKSIIIVIGVSVVVLLLSSIFIARHFYGKKIIKQITTKSEIDIKIERSYKYWFIGDSRVARWPMQQIFDEPDEVLNLGVEGQTSNETLQIYHTLLKYYKPEYVFIQVGINDLKLIGVKPEMANIVTQSTIENIVEIIQFSVKYNVRPVFITILPLGPIEIKRILFWNNKVGENIKMVNNNIVSYCNEKGVLVFDTRNLFNNDEMVEDVEYFKDALHLNENGYFNLNFNLKTFIINKLK